MTARTLRIDHFSLSLPDRNLVQDLSFSIAAGEIVTLMGASGSGKSSLLKWLVGICAPQQIIHGKAWLGDQLITAQLPEKRQLGLMFQDLGLFPHLSVRENLLIGIPARYKKRERHALAEQALRDAQLSNHGEKSIAALSGGEQARIALMRTLLAEPKALLLDEPFSALDTQLRDDIRTFTYAKIRAQQIPTLLVSHDPADIPTTASGANARVIQLDNLSRSTLSPRDAHA